jgi:PilZ domain-containing protein
VDQERRGLRFLFTAAAEIAPENSPGATVATRVAELSLHGCYVETPAPFEAETRVLVKIFHSAEYFEGKATVIYVKPAMGMGLAFREVKPNFRGVLQKWILAAMHSQKNTERGLP